MPTMKDQVLKTVDIFKITTARGSQQTLVSLISPLYLKKG